MPRGFVDGYLGIASVNQVLRVVEQPVSEVIGGASSVPV